MVSIIHSSFLPTSLSISQELGTQVLFQTPLQLGMKGKVVDSVLLLFALAAQPGKHLAIPWQYAVLQLTSHGETILLEKTVARQHQ